MSENKPKVFEDWEEVDCNECERYWLNQCDGAKTCGKGSKMPCNSFLATRNVVIPLQIKRLEKQFKRVLIIDALVGIGLIILCLIYIFGG